MEMTSLVGMSPDSNLRPAPAAVTRVRSLRVGIVLAALLACLAAASEAADLDWPPFLPRTGSARTDSAVEKIWKDTTFERNLGAAPLDIPVALYVALIDAPEVVAAAAKHLGVASDVVTLLPDGSYELTSPDGSRATIQVLPTKPLERVTLSHGQLVFHGLKINGSILGLLQLSTVGGDVHQRLTAYVHIDNPVLAWLTRTFLPLLSSKVGEVLSRGFRTTGAVATWAGKHREAFCPWQAASGFPRERLQPVADAAGCS